MIIDLISVLFRIYMLAQRLVMPIISTAVISQSNVEMRNVPEERPLMHEFSI